MSKEVRELPEGLESITTHPYCELTCEDCGSVRFYKRAFASLLPLGFAICGECGGVEMRSRNVTAWSVRLRDPLGRRQISMKKSAPTKFHHKR